MRFMKKITSGSKQRKTCVDMTKWKSGRNFCVERSLDQQKQFDHEIFATNKDQRIVEKENRTIGRNRRHCSSVMAWRQTYNNHSNLKEKRRTGRALPTKDTERVKKKWMKQKPFSPLFTAREGARNSNVSDEDKKERESPENLFLFVSLRLWQV